MVAPPAFGGLRKPRHPALLVALALGLLVCPALAADEKPTVFEKAGEPKSAGKIDEIVFAKLKAEGVRPARPCSDAAFVRRAYLDVIGTLPTAAEAGKFLADKDPNKRSRLIDALLDRDEFADYWSMKWCDVLRVKSEFPINLWPNAVQAYYRWLRTAIRDNMPYDQFVRELLTTSGSNFRSPQVNFYRAVQEKTSASLAKAAALAFMGDRQTSWPKARTDGLAAIFSRVGYKRTSEWKEEIVFFDLTKPPLASAVMPDGTTVKISPDRDPREAFADWLITPKNEWFARCMVNRTWFWLMGRGIVHEADDIRPDNKPSHPELLAYLQKELVDSKYDRKHILRLILNSATYQLSCVPRDAEAKSAALFGHYPLRRLEAEVIIDALCQVTGTTEEYSSQIPEPFTWVPEENRTIELPDGSITSTFLELFGRPPRDSGLLDERNNSPTAGQRLHLLNSSHLRKKIEASSRLRTIRSLLVRDLPKATSQLYLAILSRQPTQDEQDTIKKYIESARGKQGQDPPMDIVWALLNSPEFLYRH